MWCTNTLSLCYNKVKEILYCLPKRFYWTTIMKKKKIFISVLLTIVFIVTLLFYSSYTITSKANTGEQKYADTVYIESIDDFKFLSDSRYFDKMFLLRCDIDLSGKEWEPIDAYNMSGTFDGCGHTIKNFVIKSTSNYTGLFSRNSLNIKNLFISDVYVSCEIDGGILAGLNSGSVSNVHISGDLKAENNAGGLIAENYGEVDNCSFEGEVYGRTAGGLIAHNYGSVSNSFSKGRVTGHVIGGLIGSCGLVNNAILSVKDSFAFNDLIQVEISNGAKRAGGLIGVREQGVLVENCFAGNDFPCIAYGDFNGAKELDEQARSVKSNFSVYDFENYWDWDETLNELIQRTIAVSSNMFKVEDNNIYVTSAKAYYKNDETAILKLNVSESRPEIGIDDLQVCENDADVQNNGGEYSLNIGNLKNILVEFKFTYLIRVEINLTNSHQLSLEKDKQFYAPGEDIIFIVKEIKGYKNPMLQAVYIDESVKFTNVTTDKDREIKIQKFKAEIYSETYALNDILYVSVSYEKVNNLWWILLLSIGLPMLTAIVIIIITIKQRKSLKHK